MQPKAVQNMTEQPAPGDGIIKQPIEAECDIILGTKQFRLGDDGSRIDEWGAWGIAAPGQVPRIRSEEVAPSIKSNSILLACEQKKKQQA